jgi:hypothetical protein
LIVSRINHVGNEAGNGAYDLDRILEKTIRYERDTVAGRNLDWRANALSCITNYGGGSWDAPWLKAIEDEGGMFELRSSRGWSGLPPENIIDGRVLNAELLTQTRGLDCWHDVAGWALGGEGIMSTGLFRDIDPHILCRPLPPARAFYSLPSHKPKPGAPGCLCHRHQSGNNNSRVPSRRAPRTVSVVAGG